MNVGILGYGVYIPSFRIKTADIAAVWGKSPRDIERSLGIREKAVASFDEDVVTLGYEAAVRAIHHAGISPERIDVCFVGSESHPYAVNPTSTIIAELLGVGRQYLAADLEFACKAATAGVIATSCMIGSGDVRTGLVIGSDTAQAKPHDVLEYTAASASAALLLGRETDGCIARLVDWTSFSSDTPDFWRRDGVRFPSHGGRFTGEPAFFSHVLGAATRLMKKTKTVPSDFDYCVFHSPNGKFPQVAAHRLGFTPAQLAPSSIVSRVGNPYSASSLLGLASVLDVARSGERILLVSYGSGAGSDGFIFEVTQHILLQRARIQPVADMLRNTRSISYVSYLRFTKRI